MRAPPHRLQVSSYIHTCEVSTRYFDLDDLGHINNLAVAMLFEEARRRFFTQHEIWLQPSGPTRHEMDDRPAMMVVALALQYAAQSYYPAPVSISSGIGACGTSSFVVSQLAVQNDQPVALCDVTAVFVAGGRSVSIPAIARSSLEAALLTPAPSEDPVQPPQAACS